ncbi:MAG TPA: NUDIX hydrolase [Candidatus Sulfotelmatobacter sp.]|nr:NUDIX hydrolase [Candidatus Sulfotelmatobacter sp.]
MHKDFYASGFLYHSKSQQILLQQETSADSQSQWALFGGENKASEKTPEEAFERIIYVHLRFKINPKNVFAVYSYPHQDKNKDNFIHYAEIRKLEKFKNTRKKLFSWFTFKQVQKLKLSEQTKQDIMVSQRVIASSIRKKLGERTID